MFRMGHLLLDGTFDDEKYERGTMKLLLKEAPELDEVNYMLPTRDRRLRLKTALVQDTDYIAKKIDQLAPYLGVFGAYLIPK